MNRYLSLATLYLCCFCNQLTGQSLIHDATQIAKELRKNNIPTLEISAKKSIEIKFKPIDESPEIDPGDFVKLNPFRPRAISLINQGTYYLDAGPNIIAASACPCVVSLKYDSLQLTTDTIASGKDINKIRILNNSNAIYLFKKGEDINKVGQYILKPDFTEIYGILGAHSEGVREQVAKGERNNFEIINQLEKFDDNPFLGDRLGNFGLTNIQLLSPITDTSIFQIEEQVHAIDADYLTLDSLLKIKNFSRDDYNIQQIEQKYHSPIPNSKMALQSSADNIRIQSNRMGSSFDANTIASGLSEFIIARAQEEFNVAFMQRLRDRLNDPKYKPLQILFPRSKAFFDKDLDILNYKSILPLARQSFVDDLENIGFHFSALLQETNGEEFNNSPDLFNLSLVYEMANLVYQNVPVDTILPMIHARLADRQIHLNRMINLDLAASEKVKTQEQLKGIRLQMDTLSQYLSALNVQIVGKLFDVERSFFDLYSSIDDNLPDTLNATDRAALLNEYRGRMNELYDFYTLSTENKTQLFMQWLGSSKAEIISKNLEGRIFYDSLLSDPKLEFYNHFFGHRPDPIKLIAAGLELSQNVLHKRVGPYDNMTEFLTAYYEELLQVEQDAKLLKDQVEQTSDSALKAKVKILNDRITGFKGDVAAEVTRLDAQNIDEFDVNALRYLEGTLDNIDIEGLSSIKRIKQYLQKEEEKVNYVETLVQARLDTIQQRNNMESELMKKLQTKLSTMSADVSLSREARLLSNIRQRAAWVGERLKKLEVEFTPELLNSRDNAAVIGQVSEFSTHLLYSFRDGTDGNPKWVDRKQFRSVMRDDLSRDVFLGLVYNRLSNVQKTHQLSSDGVASITTKFMNLVAETSILRDSLSKVDNPKFVDYYPYVRLTVELLNTIVSTPLIGDLSWGDLNPEIKKVTGVAANTLSLFENIYTKDFGYAISDALQLYTIISGDTTSTTSKTILKYGSFIANVADAESADDIKAALVAAALPKGSSQLKREEQFSLSVNSYLSVGGGWERLTNSAIPADDRWAGTLSFSVPVGLTASWKFKKQEKGSFSLFLPILDLGAVTAYRIDTKNQVDELPKINFSNIIAPGAYLFYNVPKSPIMIGTGAQLGPQLREVTIAGNTLDSRAWRWMIFVGIDVPLFNLATSNKGN